MHRFAGIPPPQRRYASTVWYSRVGSQNFTRGYLLHTAMLFRKCHRPWRSPESCHRKCFSPDRKINVATASTQRGSDIARSRFVSARATRQNRYRPRSA